LTVMLEANSEANNPPLATNTLPTITLNVHHSNLMLSYINHSNLMLSFVIWSKKNLDSMDNKQQRKGDKINEVQNNDWTGLYMTLRVTLMDQTLYIVCTFSALRVLLSL
jgi:hypothetical protein